MNVQYGDQITVEAFDFDDEAALAVQYHGGKRFPVWLTRKQMLELIALLTERLRDGIDGLSR